MDYTIFYKSSFPDGLISIGETYDLLLSGFDGCERTEIIFDRIPSRSKIWLNFPHYYDIGNVPADAYSTANMREDEYFTDLMGSIDPNWKICIDITGFIRPHLIFLILLLNQKGIRKLDFIYSEPRRYEHGEDTHFSEFIDEVRLIEGCSSPVTSTDTTKDILIISAGYDDKLISKVAQDKREIRKKYFILGFPSLQPDFYQESMLKIENVREMLGSLVEMEFAPAFDPFVTAQVITEIVEANPDASNIYLSPLSTKAQTLGMTLYYMWNSESKPLNIIFPFSSKYHAMNAVGVKKTWKFTVELPAFRGP